MLEAQRLAAGGRHPTFRLEAEGDREVAFRGDMVMTLCATAAVWHDLRR
jgi:hypothetical protein